MKMAYLPHGPESFEDVAILLARRDYLDGRIDVVQFEEHVAAILAGDAADYVVGGLPSSTAAYGLFQIAPGR